MSLSLPVRFNSFSAFSRPSLGLLLAFSQPSLSLVRAAVCCIDTHGAGAVGQLGCRWHRLNLDASR